jgi:c(7)-type cytochrome triheme protein
MRGGFFRTSRSSGARRGLALLPLLWAAAIGICGGDLSASTDVAMKLPADIIYSQVAGTDQAVVFSHESHAAFVDNQCVKCHPEPFHMLQRGPAPTHDQMNNRASCGLCHDGTNAFGVQDDAACANCHAGLPAPPAAAGDAPAATDAGAGAKKLPPPHVFPPGESSPGPVTFKHETHLKGGCTACHSKLFRMAAAPPLPEGGMHEAKACGACHDGTKAFAAEDGESCVRCHIENGARP